MTLRLKLILILLGFGFILLGAMMWSQHYLLTNTMVKYVDQRDQLRLERLTNNIEVYLDEKGILSTAEIPQRVWHKLLRISHRMDLTQTYVPINIVMNYPYPKILKSHSDEFEARVSLFSAEGEVVYGRQGIDIGLMQRIELDNTDVGYLGYSHREELTEQADIEFANTQSIVLTWGAMMVVSITLLLLWPLASHFLTPIRNLTFGMRRLSQGVFSTRLAHDRKDELGQLQQDFNHLAASLEKSKQSRNEWIAAISHELRTPLTVLNGSLEAIKDGIRPANEANINLVHEEVILLTRLVDDLYQITLSDIGGLNYKMQPMDLRELLTKAVGTFKTDIEEKGLTLSLTLPEQLPTVNVDEDRFQQLIHNILLNSLAYTNAVDDSGNTGQITVLLEQVNNSLCLVVEDSAPSVSEEELTHLFERLYRTEMSRCRRHGGAGLGLAIVKEIVAAHSGTIGVEQSSLGGIKLSICLPL